MYYLVDFCRLCLSFTGEFSSICNDNIMEKVIACITDLEFEEHLPALICTKCLEKVDMFFEFRNQCLQSEFLLTRYIDKFLVQTSQPCNKFVNTKLKVSVFKDFNGIKLSSNVRVSKERTRENDNHDKCSVILQENLNDVQDQNQSIDAVEESCHDDEDDVFLEEEDDDEVVESTSVADAKNDEEKDTQSIDMTIVENVSCKRKLDEHNYSDNKKCRVETVTSTAQTPCDVQTDITEHVKTQKRLAHIRAQELNKETLDDTTKTNETSVAHLQMPACNKPIVVFSQVSNSLKKIQVPCEKINMRQINEPKVDKCENPNLHKDPKAVLPNVDIENSLTTHFIPNTTSPSQLYQTNFGNLLKHNIMTDTSSSKKDITFNKVKSFKKGPRKLIVPPKSREQPTFILQKSLLTNKLYVSQPGQSVLLQKNSTLSINNHLHIQGNSQLPLIKLNSQINGSTPIQYKFIPLRMENTTAKPETKNDASVNPLFQTIRIKNNSVVLSPSKSQSSDIRISNVFSMKDLQPVVNIKSLQSTSQELCEKIKTEYDCDEPSTSKTSPPSLFDEDTNDVNQSNGTDTNYFLNEPLFDQPTQYKSNGKTFAIGSSLVEEDPLSIGNSAPTINWNSLLQDRPEASGSRSPPLKKATTAHSKKQNSAARKSKLPHLLTLSNSEMQGRKEKFVLDDPLNILQPIKKGKSQKKDTGWIADRRTNLLEENLVIDELKRTSPLSIDDSSLGSKTFERDTDTEDSDVDVLSVPEGQIQIPRVDSLCYDDLSKREFSGNADELKFARRIASRMMRRDCRNNINLLNDLISDEMPDRTLSCVRQTVNTARSYINTLENKSQNLITKYNHLLERHEQLLKRLGSLKKNV